MAELNIDKMAQAAMLAANAGIDESQVNALRALKAQGVPPAILARMASAMEWKAKSAAIIAANRIIDNEISVASGDIDNANSYQASNNRAMSKLRRMGI